MITGYKCFSLRVVLGYSVTLAVFLWLTFLKQPDMEIF